LLVCPAASVNKSLSDLRVIASYEAESVSVTATDLLETLLTG